MYRPPPNSENKYTVQSFFDEFTEYLEDKLSITNKILICGDFNFHFSDMNCNHNQAFHNMLQSFDLEQHVVKMFRPIM